MVMSSSKPILIPETVLILKDRLKHGQNVARILESQVDTAQQNIVLLQGQVRLANETISNLKKHFQETENILTKLFEPEPPSFNYEPAAKEAVTEAHMKISEHVSPTNAHDSGTDSNKSFDGKGESNKSPYDKSPYAQQLRQVLDVLQDEEPVKGCGSMHPEASGNKECACVDCQPAPKHLDCNSSCTSDRDSKQEDNCKSKHKMNGHTGSRDVSPKSSHNSHTSYMSSHCSASCCSTTETSSYKVVEKSTPPVHYISVHSPVHGGEKRVEHHPGHHCGEKCQCHTFVNYVPYGYHVIESSPGIPESIQPISPSAKRKRSYAPHMAEEEPPHLKYTKVKRIDGNKLIAQRTLQDFTKRRFYAYNPRYDLDLLIVPPPISAFDVMKETKNVVSKLPQSPMAADGYSPEPQHHGNTSERGEPVNGVDTFENHDDADGYDDRIDDENTMAEDNNEGALVTTGCGNSENSFSDVNYNCNTVTVNMNNSNNNNMNTTYVHTLFKSPSSNVKILPAIKEEDVEGQKKLESQIAMMRAEPPGRNVSLAMKQEPAMSPITVGSNRVSLAMKQEPAMSPITVGSNRM